MIMNQGKRSLVVADVIIVRDLVECGGDHTTASVDMWMEYL